MAKYAHCNTNYAYDPWFKVEFQIQGRKTMVPLYPWYLGRFQNCRKIKKIYR